MRAGQTRTLLAFSKYIDISDNKQGCSPSGHLRIAGELKRLCKACGILQQSVTRCLSSPDQCQILSATLSVRRYPRAQTPGEQEPTKHTVRVSTLDKRRACACHASTTINRSVAPAPSSHTGLGAAQRALGYHTRTLPYPHKP